MKTTPIIMFCMLILMACEKPEKIDEYPAHKSKLVVNCLYDSDTNFLFELSKSLSPLDNAPFPIFNNRNGYVTIYENDVMFDSATYNPLYNKYVGRLRKKPTVGNTYRINAYYPGFGNVTAQDQMPNKFEVDNMSVNESIIKGEYAIEAKTTFIITPKDQLTKYIIIQILGNDTGSTFPNRFSNFDIVETSRRYNSEFINNMLYISSIDGNPITNLKIDWHGMTWGDSPDKVKIKYDFTFETCSKNSFEYKRRLNLQIINQYDPFSEPTPIHNNIVNGFGIFGGISTTLYSYP